MGRFLLAALAPLSATLMCAPFGAAGDTLSDQVDASNSDAPSRTDASSPDASSSDGAINFCADKGTTAWCFDFEGPPLGRWLNRTWLDNSELPGSLKLDQGALLADIPPWPAGGPAGRAHFFLGASFTKTLSFEWTFAIERTGPSSYALIAEILDSDEASRRSINVYAQLNGILVESAIGANAGTQIAVIPLPPLSTPLSIKLDAVFVPGGLVVRVTSSGKVVGTSAPIPDWESATTKVGIGIGDVDTANADPQGRLFRYDNVLVSTD